MNWREWKSPDGRIRCINADCLEVLPTLSGIDAVVTDPPYGMNWRTPQSPKRPKSGSTVLGDDSPFDPQPFLLWPCILWGANHYASRLPDSRRWLVWDKRCGEMPSNDQSDCELAWVSFGGSVRAFRKIWNGGGSLLAENGPARSIHPTQKPVVLMEWCLSFVPDAETILDPFAGSFTTAIACIRTDRRCIAIEKEPKYFDIGVQRIKDEYDRTRLIDAAMRPQVQRELEGCA